MNQIKPMLLTTSEVFSDSNWLYEPKYDGFRLLCGNDHSYTRNGKITTNRFHELHFDIGCNVLLDGELITPVIGMTNNFAGDISQFHRAKNQPIQFLAFDILQHGSNSVMHHPIEERKNY
jgi:DNA ligase-1